jgi:hypothetical protein
MVYIASIHTDLLSVAEVFIFSSLFFQALFMSSLAFKFSKAADVFEILIGYCFAISSSLGF